VETGESVADWTPFATRRVSKEYVKKIPGTMIIRVEYIIHLI